MHASNTFKQFPRERPAPNASGLAYLHADAPAPGVYWLRMPLLFDREPDAGNLVFAMGEAIAHLNDLMHRGGAGRGVGANGVYTFQRTEK